MRVYLFVSFITIFTWFAGESQAAVEIAPVRGTLANSFSYYLQRINEIPTIQNRFDGELEASATEGSYGVKFVPWLRVWAPDTAGGRTREVRPFFEAKEAWVERIG